MTPVLTILKLESIFRGSEHLLKFLLDITRNSFTKTCFDVKHIFVSLEEYLFFQVTPGKEVAKVNSGDCAGHEIDSPLLIQLFTELWYKYCLNEIS